MLAHYFTELMKGRMKHCITFLVSWAVVTHAFCITQENIPGQTKPLLEQYRNLSSDAETVDGFRMMKLYKMDQFWKVVQDSVRQQQVRLQEANVVLKKQAQEIEALHTAAENHQQQVEALERGVSTIIFWGKEYSKTAVVSVMGFILLALSLVSIILLITSKMALQSAREMKASNDSLNNQFEEYKHQAIEKHIKVSRELQDYKNRLAEVKKMA
jgi:hypothetical protein